MEEMVHEKDTIIRETGQQKEETLRLLEFGHHFLFKMIISF